MGAPSRGARKLIEAFDGRWNVLAKFSPLIYSFVPKLNNKFRLLIRVVHNSAGGDQSRCVVHIYVGYHMESPARSAQPAADASIAQMDERVCMTVLLAHTV